MHDGFYKASSSASFKCLCLSTLRHFPISIETFVYLDDFDDALVESLMKISLQSNVEEFAPMNKKGILVQQAVNKNAKNQWGFVAVEKKEECGENGCPLILLFSTVLNLLHYKPNRNPLKLNIDVLQ